MGALSWTAQGRRAERLRPEALDFADPALEGTWLLRMWSARSTSGDQATTGCASDGADGRLPLAPLGIAEERAGGVAGRCLRRFAV